MITLTVTATLRSPAHMAVKNTSAYFVESFGHIPGRALLGAAAWAWIDDGGDPKSAPFARFFLSGEVSWGDLLPVPEDPDTHAPAEGTPVVVPRTARRCKLHGVKHRVIDTLLRPKAIDACPHEENGGRCGAGLTGIDGAVTPRTGGGSLTARQRREHRTHLVIGLDTGTARPAYLYSREVLKEGQVFRGHIRCADEPTADALSAELERLPLAVGTGRSRGYGQLGVRVERGTEPSLTVEDFARRADEIANLVSEQGREPAPAGARYFTLTAASPWCLREPDGGYARTLTARRLAATVGLEDRAVSVVAGDGRSELRSGWDGEARLPTEVRRVIVAGSTFLCGVSGLDDSEICDRLASALQRGIGGHRVEGLGRMILNHPLHFGGAS